MSTSVESNAPVMSESMKAPRWGKKDYDSIQILGVTYKLIFSTADKYPLLNDMDGYCDTSTKTIVIDDCTDVDKANSKGDLSRYIRQVVRHECIHAALFESGLDNCCDWANCEPAVDWLAIQFPKLCKMFESIEVTK